ncbi:hypothetical protein RHMOL_Rhmol01G0236300 [Rhododendron molle]|uniref:Uncharacterized protein n=1 Tax=Rhododendron molle TaxID=49168 RepID=A0ACC0Q6A5_RHOML|nr:hypothetical protein RHMOL_Rhmol01G0236300 [Rhododendron molle]
MAELWVVRDGLWVARRFKFPHLIVETDSIFVYNALFRKQVQAGRLRRMLQEVQVLLSDFSSVHVTFCYQEANGVADLLAKHAAVSQTDFVLHNVALDFLLLALSQNQKGIVVPCFCKKLSHLHSF